METLPAGSVPHRGIDYGFYTDTEHINLNGIVHCLGPRQLERFFKITQRWGYQVVVMWAMNSPTSYNWNSTRCTQPRCTIFGKRLGNRGRCSCRLEIVSHFSRVTTGQATRFPIVLSFSLETVAIHQVSSKASLLWGVLISS